MELAKLRKKLLIVAGVAGAISLIGWLVPSSREQFFRSYLLGYLFWWGIPIGALALTMLSYLIKSNWGKKARPYFAAAVKTLPVMALLFVPLALGVNHIYIWADEEIVQHDPLLQKKAAYLNTGFFNGRAAGYFLIWIAAGLLLSRGSASAKSTHDSTSFYAGVSAIGLVLLVLTTTFAAFDWSMSLEPRWYSTIYGALIGVGAVLTAMAMAIIAFAQAPESEPSANDHGDAGHHAPPVLGDLGTLLLAILMVWAYFTVSQFLIIWSGNLPDESVWYIRRINGGWQFVGLAIVVLHFVVPFLLLLPRENRCDPRKITRIAVLLLVIHFVELFWHVAPAPDRDRFSLHWLDLTLPLAIGGLWMYLFIGKLPQPQTADEH